MSRTWGGALLLAVAVLGAGAARARLTALERASAGSRELLYLPNGKHLRAASLGQASIVADVVYFWAIQYYSDYERADRFRYIEHVFGQVIPDLDPHFIDPYWLGALILTTEAQDLEGGLRLLDLGYENNPTSWILPFLAGWECNHVGAYDRAARYFDRAAATPGAPAPLLRLSAGMRARGGNLREAIEKWGEVLMDPRGNDASRAIARRQLRTLKIKSDLQEIDAAIAAYRSARGEAPRRLEDLVRAGFLRALPVDPDGKPYAYDAAAGTAQTDATRVLGS